MDIVEVTLRLDRELAERLRRDPAERARYEVFLGLAAAAQTSAQVEQAARLFTAPPAERQCLLVEMLDGAFGSDLALALRGGAAAWSAAVCRALSTEAPQAAVDPPSVRDEGRAATVGRALGGRTLGEGERAAPARRSDASPHAPLVLPGVSALLLLMLGGGTMALWWSAISQQGPAFASAAVEGRAGRPPGLPKPLGPGVVAPDHATAGPEANPASRPMPSAPYRWCRPSPMSPTVVLTGAPPSPSASAAGPAEPAGPSLADALEPSAASGALRIGMEAPRDPPGVIAPSFVAAVGSPAGTGGGPEPPRAEAEGVSGGLDAAGSAPPDPGRGDSASRPAAAGRVAAAVVVHHRAGSPAAERAARLGVEEVRGAGLGGAAVRAVPAVPARRVIRFGRGEDGAAERLALRLRRRWPHPWRLEAAVSPGPARPAPPLEVWLPHR